MRKKILSMLVCISMAAALVACGSEDVAEESKKEVMTEDTASESVESATSDEASEIEAGSGATDEETGNEADEDAETTEMTEETETEVETEEPLSYVSIDPESVAESPYEDFVYEVRSGRASITGYVGAGGQVRIPAHFDGADKIRIEEGAFKNNDNITFLYVPEDTWVGDKAFKGCSALEQLCYMPKSDVTCSAEIFYECTALKYVTIANGVVGADMFDRCSELEYVEFVGEGEVMIGPGGFQACRKLRFINFPKELTQISDLAFKQCGSLKTVDLSECSNLTLISSGAFAECLNLSTFIIPAEFEYQKQNQSHMDENPFYGSKNLTEITIPEGNTSYVMEDGMLYGIGTRLDTANNEYPIKEAISALSTPEVFTFPADVNSIYHGVFKGSPNTKEVFVPDTVTTIFGNAFSVTDLEVIHIRGNDLTPSDTYAFIMENFY